MATAVASPPLEALFRDLAFEAKALVDSKLTSACSDAQSIDQLVMPRNDGMPRCWDKHSNSMWVEVDPESKEFKLVEGHLRQTLQTTVRTVKVLRIQNEKIFKTFSRDTAESIMFHGCKSEANEGSIVAHGFSLSTCKSLVNDQRGVWFSHTSEYSNRSFAFSDTNGWRHLFVCIVSKHGLLKNDGQMRVVDQFGAYPQWIVHYQ